LGEPYAPLDPDNTLDVSADSRIKKGFKAACKRAGIATRRVNPQLFCKYKKH
jgi:hypothetical protein